MSQHDYVIANQSGSAFRADLNNALAASVSINSGSSAPSTTYAYMLWADTSNNVIKLRNSANSAWLTLFTTAGGVDVDAASNFNEDVTFTGATSGRDILFDKSGNALVFKDNALASFGTDADLTLYHSGSHAIVDNNTGSLIIKGDTTSIKNAGDSYEIATFNTGYINLNGARSVTVPLDGSGNVRIAAGAAGGHAISTWDTNNYTAMQFVREVSGSASQVGTITCTDTSTTYATSSDYRLKENAVAISDGITRLKTLKPYRFNFKVDPSITVDGFFAHEVSAAVPEAISGEKDEMKSIYYKDGDALPSGKKVGDFKEYSTTEINPQGIDQSKIVPLLVASLQEAITKIETLETKVAALESA